MKTITIDCTNKEWRDGHETECDVLQVLGSPNLNDVNELKRIKTSTLDLSQAQWGTDYEQWVNYLGFSHSGPVYGNSGYREVDVLCRLLENTRAEHIILPDDVARRHVNRIIKNLSIKSVDVSDNCKLFAMKDGDLWNKKLTRIVMEKR